jgi:hypothetical protein
VDRSCSNIGHPTVPTCVLQAVSGSLGQAISSLHAWHACVIADGLCAVDILYYIPIAQNFETYVIYVCR